MSRLCLWGTWGRHDTGLRHRWCINWPVSNTHPNVQQGQWFHCTAQGWVAFNPGYFDLHDSVHKRMASSHPSIAAMVLKSVVWAMCVAGLSRLRLSLYVLIDCIDIVFISLRVSSASCQFSMILFHLSDLFLVMFLQVCNVGLQLLYWIVVRHGGCYAWVWIP